MAATLYSKLLKEWYWEKMSKAMDKVADEYKNMEGGPPENGLDGGINFPDTGRISCWAGKSSWDDDNSFRVSIYIGSVFNIMPSGKFYMPWTTNQTDEDVRKDEQFMRAFEKCCNKWNMWLDSGEGSGDDMFLNRSYDYGSN
jgi:hypothetical protein